MPEPYIPPRTFNKYAEKNDYHWRDYDRGTKYRRHADRVAAWIKEKIVLDIGAGDGKITSLLGSLAVGIDNEPIAVRIAIEKGVRVLPGTAYDLPFQDKTFQSVLMADALEHFEFPGLALTEARRVLSEYLYITTPPKRADGKLTDRYHWREYSPEELKAEVEGVGFELVGEIDVVVADKVMYAKFRRAPAYNAGDAVYWRGREMEVIAVNESCLIRDIYDGDQTEVSESDLLSEEP